MSREFYYRKAVQGRVDFVVLKSRRIWASIFSAQMNPRDKKLTASPEASISDEVERVYIVGSGFSWYAGMPLTSEFTQELLAARHSGEGPSLALVEFLSGFVRDVFGHEKSANAMYWPGLEDLFTCIDLAANSGHNLGAGFSSSRLRTVRRALIVRIMRMLAQRHLSALQRKDSRWQLLKRFLTRVDYANSAFISMNWDAVIEHRFFALHKNGEPSINYGCDAISAAPPASGSEVVLRENKREAVARIVKMHGSINWLYCDNCQRVFWFGPWKTRKFADQLLSEAEWKDIWPSASKQVRESWTCTFCPTVRLSTRLATFSYRKALDFPMFQKSWFSAERLLRQAKTWAFIGYSMPAADYQFKYLLKRVQASRPVPPRLVLVTGGEGAEETYRNYQRFFGLGIDRETNCFFKGLDGSSIDYLIS